MKKKNYNTLKKRRLQLLNQSENIVTENGWNKLLFKKISLQKKIHLGELEILFPKGYEDMLELSLDNLNYKLEDIYKYYNFKKKPLHKKIKEIIITKINLINKKKNFYRRTFYYLLVPSNYKLMIKQLYKSINLIWYISGDNSTDFNFYTKRFILFLVYSTVILNFLKNDDLIETEKLLDDNLYKVSKIPKIKEKFKIVKKSFPSLFNILKNYSY